LQVCVVTFLARFEIAIYSPLGNIRARL